MRRDPRNQKVRKLSNKIILGESEGRVKLWGKGDGESVVSTVWLENIKYIQKYTGISHSYLRELHLNAVLIFKRRRKMVIAAWRPHLNQSIPW